MLFFFLQTFERFVNVRIFSMCGDQTNRQTEKPDHQINPIHTIIIDYEKQIFKDDKNKTKKNLHKHYTK